MISEHSSGDSDPWLGWATTLTNLYLLFQLRIYKPLNERQKESSMVSITDARSFKTAILAIAINHIPQIHYIIFEISFSIKSAVVDSGPRAINISL